MKYKTQATTFIFTLILSLSYVGHSIYAQEFSPLGELAQDYLQRLNENLSKIDANFPSPKQRTVIVNPEGVSRDAVKESIDTISKTVGEVTEEKEKVMTDIKATVKEDIDNSIIQIRKEVEKPAQELQRAVDVERATLFENITQTIESVQPTQPINPLENKKTEIRTSGPAQIEKLKTQVDASLEKIKVSLETESGLPLNFEKSQRDIKVTLLNFEKVLTQKKEIIESRQGDLVFEDTDSDGLSDYDETFIYKTDPKNARTKEGEKTDGEKIKAGINPLAEREELIKYQDPRTDKDSFVSSSYRVDKVQLVKEDTKKLVFEGVALPNTFITLYIYSTPIIVTVTTNANGQWSYELEKEIGNGEHQMFVATVDTSGKIIARSSPVPFTKSAEAASIGIEGDLNIPFSTQNFLQDNFILITLMVLILVVVLGMVFVGKHSNIKSALSELKNEINSQK